MRRETLGECDLESARIGLCDPALLQGYTSKPQKHIAVQSLDYKRNIVTAQHKSNSMFTIWSLNNRNLYSDIRV